MTITTPDGFWVDLCVRVYIILSLSLYTYYIDHIR